MFEIIKEDTGEDVHFRHIHGDGFDTITADGHQGQALGMIMTPYVSLNKRLFIHRTWTVL